ncbi:substrate-binding periplasmic protein [Litorilituus sediminis]|uniref:Transporter substrate-binding domain-containing protein n=1 Tax=Litorilituus sediminis TaxID=718192 RepID=A0A4V0ZGH1_9GAMM|nr:transporter substrate-binding domain-containing protein [Litorilituus sediminis]QBG37280.1 transporter substrate-binding domain-containing protein [Litorilituus sediminis]
MSWRIFIFYCLCLLSITASAADKIRVYVEHIPPFVFTDENKISGMAIDIINQAAKASGIKVEYQEIVWSRAFHEAKHKANVMLTGLVRTKSREHDFHWLLALPMAVKRQNIYLWGLTKNAREKAPKDISNAMVAVVLGDHKVQYYKNYMDKLGLRPNIYTVGSREQVIHMLFRNRVDYILSGELARSELIDSLGYDVSLIERGPQMLNTSKGLYIALSKPTNSALVKRLEKALNALVSSGVISEIATKWQSQ